MTDTTIIIGTNSWGGSLYSKILRGSSVSKETIKQTAELAINNGFIMFDTARNYGFGKSQKLIGEFALPEMKISTKFTPFSKKYKPGQVRKSLEKRLKRLQQEIRRHLLASSAYVYRGKPYGNGDTLPRGQNRCNRNL